MPWVMSKGGKQGGGVDRSHPCAIICPLRVPSDSFILSFSTDLGNHLPVPGTLSLPKQSLSEFQCVFQQQKSTAPTKDGRKFRFERLPPVGLARGYPRRLSQYLGQRRVTVQDPKSKETFHGAETSLGAEGP